MHLGDLLKRPRMVRFALPTKADLHALAHSGENWAHRGYLALVGFEVKYWYGKAAILILILECILFFCKEDE